MQETSKSETDRHNSFRIYIWIKVSTIIYHAQIFLYNYASADVGNLDTDIFYNIEFTIIENI